MESLKKLIDGNKMYITAAVVAATAAAQYLGYTVPDYVYTILAAFGVYATKSAIVKSGPQA